MTSTEPQDRHAPHKLGTFTGVFTPSVLTILGIILFMRLGFVVGTAGLGRALGIILLANTISVLTSISLATVATNLRAKGGGDYYLISRTLGVGFGGALGLVLFLAQSVSIAFYAIGFAEVTVAMSGAEAAWLPRAVAATAVLLLFVLAWLGADQATKFQLVVMALLFVGIATFLVGGALAWDPATLRANWQAGPTLPFWAVFAIFFPAVTGFTQGVSMSGDLADPGRSLPTGTFLAVGVSLVVYLLAAVVLAASSPPDVLAADYGALRRVALAGWLVDAGVIAATLSSGLASFLGAPRILQSLAADRIFPVLSPFAVGAGPSNNPRRGVLLSLGIALATVALGDLNVVAPVVSMFFLISYGLLNYATWYEASADSPFFRPRFKGFHPLLSLAGALACLGTMLAVDPVAGIASLAILFGIYHWVQRAAPVERFADSSRAHRLKVVRDNLYALSDELEHPRDWRPVILAFSDDPERRERIVRFASWLEGGSGFTTVVSLLDEGGPEGRARKAQLESALRKELAEHELEAFPLCVTGEGTGPCLSTLLQAHGLGAIRANTVILNWFDQESQAIDAPAMRAFGRHLRLALRHGCSVVILEATTRELELLAATPATERRIDVWYRGDATARLCLLFAYLMTRSAIWRDAPIRLLAVRGTDDGPEDRCPTDAHRAEMLRAMLAEVRIGAEPVVVPDMTTATIARHSGDASLVFLPFRLCGHAPSQPSGEPLDALIAELPLTALVLAAQDIDLDAEPEAGEHGRIAAAADRAERTAKVAAGAERDAERAAEAVGEARDAVRSARAGGAAADRLDELEAAAADAEAEADAAHRRASRARAKADDAAADAARIGGGADADAADSDAEAATDTMAKPAGGAAD